MGKLHKDLATFMVEIAEAEGSSDIQCIKVCLSVWAKKICQLMNLRIGMGD